MDIQYKCFKMNNNFAWSVGTSKIMRYQVWGVMSQQKVVGWEMPHEELNHQSWGRNAMKGLKRQKVT